MNTRTKQTLGRAFGVRCMKLETQSLVGGSGKRGSAATMVDRVRRRGQKGTVEGSIPKSSQYLPGHGRGHGRSRGPRHGTPQASEMKATVMEWA